MRQVSEPPIARIGACQTPRGARHLRRKCFPELHDLELGEITKIGEGERGAERVFLFPQMSDHGDAKTARRRFTRGVDFG